MPTFSQWYEEHLAEYTEDINNHGCDGGFPHITYTADTVEIYDEFEDEVYEALNEDADNLGYDNVEQLVSSFNRSDMLSWPEGRKNLLVWYMVEREARRRED